METTALLLADGTFLASGAGGATPIIAIVVTCWLVAAGSVAWKRTLGLSVTALIGVAVSIYLGFQHGVDAGASICSVSDLFNCDTVNRSVYSEVAGIPIAFLGTGFYVAVAVAGFLAHRDPARFGKAPAVIFGGSLLAVAYSGFLAWASTQVGAWCLFCINLYGLNLVLLVGSLLAARARGDLVGSLIGGLTGKDDRSTSVMAVAFAATVGLSLVGFKAAGGSAGPGAGAVQDLASGQGDEIDPKSLLVLYDAPRYPLEVDGTEPILGDPNAPYVVVEFADYECPHCAATAPKMHELVERRPQIQVRFKHYPISGICNEAISAEGHKNSCNAAAAAECARLQERFWPMSDLMFKNQQYLSKDDIRFMAGQVGLDMAAFETCMADPSTRLAVQVDAAAGERAGLRGTPTLYLQGVKPGGEWVHVKGLEEEVEALVLAHEMGIELPPTPPYAPN